MNRTQLYSIKKRNFPDFSANAWIIIITVFLSIAGFFLFLNPSILEALALKPSNVVERGYLWTLITHIFLHGGIFHLMVNMFSLFFMGSFIEKLLGKKRYFYFYILSGIFAALFSIALSYIFNSGIDSLGVGASGAIFALIGFLMLITPNLPVYVMFIPIPIKMKYAAPGILVLLWLVSYAAGLNIGNFAHFGGLVVGIAYGIYIRMKYKRKVKVINKFLFAR